jgi:nucleotide-binding universal stress UspA family protein
MTMELFRRILVPYDFSDAADAALTVAAELAARHRGTISVLHVIAPVYPVSAFPGAGDIPVWVPPEDVREDTRRRLADAVTRRVGRRARGIACRVVVGDPHHSIVEAARRSDAVVMGTVGRTGLAHLLIGSVAEKVVRHSPVPVLTIRPTRRLRAGSGGGRRGAARDRGARGQGTAGRRKADRRSR